MRIIAHHGRGQKPERMKFLRILFGNPGVSMTKEIWSFSRVKQPDKFKFIGQTGSQLFAFAVFREAMRSRFNSVQCSRTALSA